MYCRVYKQAPVGHAHGLLRKARRLDQVLNTPISSHILDNTSTSPELQCFVCDTRFSPFFHSVNQAPDKPELLCHACYFSNFVKYVPWSERTPFFEDEGAEWNTDNTDGIEDNNTSN